MRKMWTSEEAEMLWDLRLTTSNADLALIFDVTASSIANQLRTIRVTKGACGEDVADRCTGASKRWTTEEAQRLRDLFPTTTDEDLAKLFNRSLSSIANKIHVLQLIRPGRVGKHKAPEKFAGEVASLAPSLVLIDRYTDSKTRVRVKSRVCGHEWEIQPNAFLQGTAGRKCPICLPRTSKPPEIFEAEAKKLAPNIQLLEKYCNSNTGIKVRDLKCGHEWDIYPKHFLDTHNHSGRKCPVCLPGSSKPPEIFEAEAKKLAPNLELLGKYVNNRTRINVKSKVCGHEWEIIPNGFLLSSRGVRCPICLPGSSKSPEIFEAELRELAPDLELLDKYTHNKARIRVKSKICGHEWEIIPNGLLSRQGCGKVCPVCHPKGISKAEIDLGDFLSKYTEVVRGDRSLLDGREIDIYLPEHNLGIEYNGIYWHSEKFKSKEYHLEKTKLAASKGITLIHVSEHEDMEIVKSQLLSLIGKDYALSAEKTEVKQLDYFPEDFLDTNHIQGACSPSEINLGMHLKDELVAVMTLGKSNSEGYEWELTRYCSLLNVTVVGGASKLLKYFVKSHSPKSIFILQRQKMGGG